MSTAVSIVRTLLGLLFDHTIGNIVRMIPIIRLPKLERGPVSRGFLALLLGILFFGLTLLFSASYSSAYASSGKLYSIIKPQVMIALVGLFFMWVLSNINYRALRLMSESLYIITIVLLILALLSPQDTNGTYRWVYLPGGASFQPSELVKLCFIFAGASTLQRLMTRRNLFLYIVYSAAICGCLALINDFGTAIIFFVTFLVTAFMRSGDFATIGLACAGTAFAGVLVLRFLPYARNRFEAWGHVWDYALTTGYSQTRSMMCIASGGLLGLGAGNGWLKYVAAADTDLVFAFVAEEWGLLIALMLVAAIVLLAASGFGVFRIGRGAQEIAGTFDADPGTFVQHDIAFILNTFSDPNGGSAQYGVVPIGGKLVAFRFPARWNASVKTISDATTSVLSGQSYSVDSFIRVTGTVKTMPEAVSSALYDWYTENNAYLQQIGAIGDSDDAADYLPDAIVCVDTVGSIPQGWVEGLTVAAVACLIYAIVVLIRILCGKYEQEKLPDITFELVDMAPETEAKPETAPEADSAPEAEPEAEAAQPEKSEETEDTPDA